MRPRIAVFSALMLSAVLSLAQGGVSPAPQDKVSKLLPATVFLDGENVPTQARNSAGVMVNSKLALFALIDTTGYSAAYQAKYTGTIQTQCALKLGTQALPAGGYGFGQTKDATGAVSIKIYDLGGGDIGTVATERDDSVKPVKPLQISTANGATRLCLGPHCVAVTAP